MAKSFGKVEAHGIDIIPDSTRHGTPKDLFWPWFAGNATFINMIAGVIANNVMNSYSSGLSLLALGARIKRYESVLVDTIITALVACIVIFIFDFSSVFIQFLSVIVIFFVPWTGIFLVDYFLRKGNYVSDDLLRSKGGSYWYSNGFHWPALIALTIGVVSGGLTANTALFQGFIAMDYLGGADISPFAGLILGGGVYYLLVSSKFHHPQE